MIEFLVDFAPLDVLTSVLTLTVVAGFTRPGFASGTRAYFTDARMAVVRHNLEHYDWAREQRLEIIRRAEHWAGYGDAKLRTLVSPPQVPRGYQVHNDGCPVHGVKVHEQGLYRWIIDFDRPYKVTCPVGGETYPSNDFEAFLATDMNDRSQLTGPYADDGWGWHRPGDPVPANYWFVAYYAHWSMMRFLMEAIEVLGQGTVLAEDGDTAKRYAHKCALLLWQLAEYYPDYRYEIQSRESKEHNPEYTGKLFNMIWATRPPHTCAIAYDAVRPYLNADVELQDLSGNTGAEVDAAIRERLLREAAKCIMDASGGRIRGNYGMHQKALLTLSQVLSASHGHPHSEEMVRYVLANPNPVRDTDMGLRDALENLVYRDGMPHESLSYNRIWVHDLTELAALMVDAGVNLFEHPRYGKLVTWAFDVCIAGKFTPSTGDSGDMFAHGGAWEPAVCQLALPHVSDARLAWVLKTQPGVRQDLFNRPVEERLSELPEGEAPEIGLRSFHFPAYGMANLQCGDETNRSAVSFFYGDHQAHRHFDQLNILFFSYENALLTDIGYPEQTDAFNHRLAGFFTNTVAHNTVVVDEVRQGRGPGRLHGLVGAGFAQVVDASCEGAYPGRVDRYRRANMLVEASPGCHYLFDVFYVNGGTQHDYMLHGNQAAFDCRPALGPVRETGTLAGEDVPYEQFYDDPELKDKRLSSVPYRGYQGSGYQFLYNVQTGNLNAEAIADWRLTEPLEGQPERPWQGIGLRAHLMGKNEELFACDGPVQKYETLPESVKFLVRRRTGANLSSLFATVFEPYKDRTWIRSATRIELTPDGFGAAAVRVDLEDGSVHYLFHALDAARTYSMDNGIEVTGQTAFLALDRQRRPVRAMLFNGRMLAMDGLRLEGKGMRRSRIASVDYPRGTIGLDDAVIEDTLRPGQAIPVVSDGYSDSLTLSEVIDRRRLSIGDEDVNVAGGPVLDASADRLFTSASNPHAHEGMTLLNRRGEPQGRLAGKVDGGWRIDREGRAPMTMEDFPVADGDDGPRFSVAMVGAGDWLEVPNLVLFPNG